MTVIAPLELDDAVAPGCRAGQPDRTHCRLRARVDHPHHVQRRHDAAEAFGHLDLGRARRAETEAATRGLLHSGNDGGMGMAGDHRAPGTDVVDVGPALDVIQAGSFGAFEKHRVAADAVESPYRGVYAARYVHAGA